MAIKSYSYNELLQSVQGKGQAKQNKYATDNMELQAQSLKSQNKSKDIENIYSTVMNVAQTGVKYAAAKKAEIDEANLNKGSLELQASDTIIKNQMEESIATRKSKVGEDGVEFDEHVQKTWEEQRKKIEELPYSWTVRKQLLNSYDQNLAAMKSSGTDAIFNQKRQDDMNVENIMLDNLINDAIKTDVSPDTNLEDGELSNIQAVKKPILDLINNSKYLSPAEKQEKIQSSMTKIDMGQFKKFVTENIRDTNTSDLISMVQSGFDQDYQGELIGWINTQDAIANNEATQLYQSAAKTAMSNPGGSLNIIETGQTVVNPKALYKEVDAQATKLGYGDELKATAMSSAVNSVKAQITSNGGFPTATQLSSYSNADLLKTANNMNSAKSMGIYNGLESDYGVSAGYVSSEIANRKIEDIKMTNAEITAATKIYQETSDALNTRILNGEISISDAYAALKQIDTGGLISNENIVDGFISKYMRGNEAIPSMQRTEWVKKNFPSIKNAIKDAGFEDSDADDLYAYAVSYVIDRYQDYDNSYNGNEFKTETLSTMLNMVASKAITKGADAKTLNTKSGLAWYDQYTNNKNFANNAIKESYDNRLLDLNSDLYKRGITAINGSDSLKQNSYGDTFALPTVRDMNDDAYTYGGDKGKTLMKLNKTTNEWEKFITERDPPVVGETGYDDNKVEDTVVPNQAVSPDTLPVAQELENINIHNINDADELTTTLEFMTKNLPEVRAKLDTANSTENISSEELGKLDKLEKSMVSKIKQAKTKIDTIAFEKKLKEEENKKSLTPGIDAWVNRKK